MESGAKLLGHPVHPMLIVFPLGLLPTSLLFDIIYLSTSDTRWSDISFWLIVVGVIGALSAAVFGLVDFLRIPRETRAYSIGLWHGVGNVIVVVLFIISWYLRASGQPLAPSNTAIVLSVIGVILAIGTAWLGGELVDKLGVGVDDDANLNAPSSLAHAY